MEMENLGFPDALKFCANKLGITLSNSGGFKKNQQEELLKRTLLEINRFAAGVFNYSLNDNRLGKMAYEYCIQRGIDDNVLKDYIVGYSPSNLNLAELIETKIKLPEVIFTDLPNKVTIDYSSNFNKILQISGLFTFRNGNWVTKFKDRLMFPILGQQGEILGFSGRVVRKGDERPKYINSPETLVYKKSDVLFNFYHAKQDIKKKNFVIITEGQLDAIMSSKVGVRNIVAPLGTSLTIENINFLKRYTDNFYLCFDQDDAGIKASKRAYEMITPIGGEVKIINFEGVKDIDELIKISPEKYISSIENAEDYILHLLSNIKVGIYDSDIIEKSKKIEELIYFVLLKKSQVEKHEYLKKVSTELQIPLSELILTKPDRKPIANRRLVTEDTYDLENLQNASVDNILNTTTYDPKELFLLALAYNYESINSDFKNLPIDFFSTVENKYINKITSIFENDDLALQVSLQRIPEEEEVANKDYIQLKNRLLIIYKKRQMKKREIEVSQLSDDPNEIGLDNNLREVMKILKENNPI